MKLADFQSKLIAVARAHPPGDQIPYAFEKRVMAHLSSKAMVDLWAVWARALWRAAAPCIAITMVLSAWSYFSPLNGPQPGDLSQELENAVLAALRNRGLYNAPLGEGKHDISCPWVQETHVPAPLHTAFVPQVVPFALLVMVQPPPVCRDRSLAQ